MFFFGHEQLGNGTCENPCHIGFTSLRLLQNIEHNDGDVLFHIDLTYKIVRQSYPLLVFGVSDASRQYHQVAFLFMSHWTQENFKHFFKTLMDILSKFNMRLDIKTLVQDHDSGCLNEIKSIFPESLIVMCFFSRHDEYKNKKTLYQQNIIMRSWMT